MISIITGSWAVKHVYYASYDVKGPPTPPYVNSPHFHRYARDKSASDAARARLQLRTLIAQDNFSEIAPRTRRKKK